MNTQFSEVCDFSAVMLPNQGALRHLAMNDSGFVFDSISGNSFTVNSTGLAVLRLLQHKDRLNEIVDCLVAQYDVESRQVERDVLDFLVQLRKHYQ
jgi:PqqD family protein of HPr-rel-A system